MFRIPKLQHNRRLSIQLRELLIQDVAPAINELDQRRGRTEMKKVRGGEKGEITMITVVSKEGRGKYLNRLIATGVSRQVPLYTSPKLPVPIFASIFSSSIFIWYPVPPLGSVENVLTRALRRHSKNRPKNKTT